MKIETRTMHRSTPVIAATLVLGTIGGRLFLVPAPLVAASPQGEKTLSRTPSDQIDADGLPRGVDPQRITPVVRAVRRAGPSVVNIQVGDRVMGRQGPMFRKLGEGSGVIVSADGLVITNWHVVRFKDQVQDFVCKVSLRDGHQHDARVVSTSPKNDLALLVIDAPPGQGHRYPPISMGDSDTLMVGETVIAIGNPRGQQNTVTTGVLSAVNRSLTVTPQGERNPIVFGELLQTDAAINPGNSGGALLDITGNLIGINTLMQIESQNIGFSIPVNRVRQVFESELLSPKGLDRLYTGFDVREAGDGLVVSEIVPSSPADMARLSRGDRIVRIGDKEIRSKQEFAKALITYRPGDRIPLGVRDGDETVWKRVVVWSEPIATIFRLTGLVTGDLEARTNADAYAAIQGELGGWRGGAGIEPVQIAGVQKDSPAEELGLRRGDIVVGIYDAWGRRQYFTGGPQEFANVLDASRGSSGLLWVYRPGDGFYKGRLSVR